VKEQTKNENKTNKKLGAHGTHLEERDLEEVVSSTNDLLEIHS